MNNYEVFFDIYGKKLRVTVMAESEKEAKELVKNKITFHKIVKRKHYQDNENQTKLL